MGVEREPGRVQPVREGQDCHSGEVGGCRGGGAESWQKGYRMGAGKDGCAQHTEMAYATHVPVLHTYCVWVYSDLGRGQKSPEFPEPAVQ